MHRTRGLEQPHPHLHQLFAKPGHVQGPSQPVFSRRKLFWLTMVPFSKTQEVVLSAMMAAGPNVLVCCVQNFSCLFFCALDRLQRRSSSQASDLDHDVPRPLQREPSRAFVPHGADQAALLLLRGVQLCQPDKVSSSVAL